MKKEGNSHIIIKVKGIYNEKNQYHIKSRNSFVFYIKDCYIFGNISLFPKTYFFLFLPSSLANSDFNCATYELLHSSIQSTI